MEKLSLPYHIATVVEAPAVIGSKRKWSVLMLKTICVATPK